MSGIFPKIFEISGSQFPRQMGCSLFLSLIGTNSLRSDFSFRMPSTKLNVCSYPFDNIIRRIILFIPPDEHMTGVTLVMQCRVPNVSTVWLKKKHKAKDAILWLTTR